MRLRSTRQKLIAGLVALLVIAGVVGVSQLGGVSSGGDTAGPTVNTNTWTWTKDFKSKKIAVNFTVKDASGVKAVSLRKKGTSPVFQTVSVAPGVAKRVTAISNVSITTTAKTSFVLVVRDRKNNDRRYGFALNPPDDVTAPTITATTPATTTTRNIVVSASAKDTSGIRAYRISIGKAAPGKYISWRGAQTAFPVTLPALAGRYKVHFWAIDSKINTALKTLTVTYGKPTTPIDDVPPTKPTFEYEYTEDGKIQFSNIVATDNVKVTGMRFCDDDGVTCTPWAPPVTSYLYTIPGSADGTVDSVSVEVTDAAGNFNFAYTGNVLYRGTVESA